MPKVSQLGTWGARTGTQAAGLLYPHSTSVSSKVPAEPLSPTFRVWENGNSFQGKPPRTRPAALYRKPKRGCSHSSSEVWLHERLTCPHGHTGQTLQGSWEPTRGHVGSRLNSSHQAPGAGALTRVPQETASPRGGDPLWESPALPPPADTACACSRERAFLGPSRGGSTVSFRLWSLQTPV